MSNRSRLVALLICALATVAQAPAQVIAPEFAANYSLTDLGSIAGVPPEYGGVFFLPGQPNTLYIGGDANVAAGAFYAVPLVRDTSGRITGFAGPAVRVADAPFNDGGIVRDPGGLISYGQWPANVYAQVNLTTGLVVNQIPLGPFGVASASAAVAFIPVGYPGAGGMRIASWAGGEFYQVAYTVGAGGIISISSVTPFPTSTLPGGPEGWAYVPFGSPNFSAPSMIVSEYSAGEVSVYEMNSAGNPIIATRRLFINNLTGAEGAAIDPVTGNFVFSTFGGGNRVIVVRGFAPVTPPAPAAEIPVGGFPALVAMALMLAAFGWIALRNGRLR